MSISLHLTKTKQFQSQSKLLLTSPFLLRQKYVILNTTHKHKKWCSNTQTHSVTLMVKYGSSMYEY